MRKILLCLATIGILVLFSCEKNDDNNNNTTEQPSNSENDNYDKSANPLSKINCKNNEIIYIKNSPTYSDYYT